LSTLHQEEWSRLRNELTGLWGWLERQSGTLNGNVLAVLDCPQPADPHSYDESTLPVALAHLAHIIRTAQRTSRTYARNRSSDQRKEIYPRLLDLRLASGLGSLPFLVVAGTALERHALEEIAASRLADR